MTAIQLNDEIARNLNIISEDETMLERVAKYIRRIAKQISHDPTLMSKEDFIARVDEAEKDIAAGKGTTFTNAAEMNAWLNAL